MLSWSIYVSSFTSGRIYCFVLNYREEIILGFWTVGWTTQAIWCHTVSSQTIWGPAVWRYFLINSVWMILSLSQWDLHKVSSHTVYYSSESKYINSGGLCAILLLIFRTVCSSMHLYYQRIEWWKLHFNHALLTFVKCISELNVTTNIYSRYSVCYMFCVLTLHLRIYLCGRLITLDNTLIEFGSKVK